MKSVVITGTSGGIGLCTARHFLAAGWRVFGSVRKADDASRLQAELGTAFTPLMFDTTDDAAVMAGADTVRAALNGAALDGLIANAGILVAGPLQYIPMADFQRQIDVNITGTLRTVRAFSPLLHDDTTPGRILLLSSVAGQTVVPFNGPYSISKYGVEAMADALRYEMRPFGIRVVAIEPGPVQSDIWAKTDAIDLTPYRNTPYAGALGRVKTYMQKAAANALPTEAAARCMYRAMTVASPKARYLLTRGALAHRLQRHMPTGWIDGLVTKIIGLNPPKKRNKP